MTTPSPLAHGTAIRVMLGRREGWLKMKLPASAEVAVIGWVQPTAAVDAGIPAEIASLLSLALTEAFRVTFLDPESSAPLEWLARKDRWVRSLPATGLASLLRSRDVVLLSTTEPEVAQTLFTAASAWSREAQVVLLTPPSHLPPDLDDHALTALLQHGRLGESTEHAEFLGLLLPGPDGDFAQFVGLQPGSLAILLNHLAAQAAATGVPFEIVSPEAFAQTRWTIEEVGN